MIESNVGMAQIVTPLLRRVLAGCRKPEGKLVRMERGLAADGYPVAGRILGRLRNTRP
jgi:hypothetical protein